MNRRTSRPWGRRAAFVAAGAGGAALLRRAGAVAAVADVISELRPPDLARWSHLVEQPVADDRARGRVRVQFLGVATLVISDGVSTILIDGFFSRPGVLRVRLGRLRPKERRITSALHRARTRHVDALFVAHSHYDHALDSAVVAGLTGAELHGSRSTRAIARSQGFDLGRFRPISTGAPVVVGDFTVTALPAQHSPGDLAPGHVDDDLSARPRVTDLRTGDCYSFHVEHPAGTLLVHPSANYLPGVLAAHPADTVYLGIGALGKQPPAFREAYWNEVVAATGATRVVAIHWDNFTRSLDRPLQALPPRFDDVHTSLEFLDERCADSGTALVLPRLWDPVDPFAPVGDHHL